MTKLREEEAQKRKSHEAAETILAIGEEGKKGRKAAREYFTEEEKKGLAKRDTYKQMLQDSSKGKIITYNILLSRMLQQLLSGVDWPAGWIYVVVPDNVGVILELKTPEGRLFRAAFKSTTDPIYDLNAVETYAVRAENTIDRIMGKDRLVLPKGYDKQGSLNN